MLDCIDFNQIGRNSQFLQIFRFYHFIRLIGLTNFTNLAVFTKLANFTGLADLGIRNACKIKLEVKIIGCSPKLLP